MPTNIDCASCGQPFAMSYQDWGGDDDSHVCAGCGQRIHNLCCFADHPAAAAWSPHYCRHRGAERGMTPYDA